MAKDVVPALLESIQKDFSRRVKNDAAIARIANRIKGGTATLDEVHDYAQHLGETLSASLLDNLTERALPDGRLYWNIADRTIRPMLETNHALTNDAAAAVQKAIDEAQGIGLKTVRGELPTARIKGILDKAVEEDTFDAMREWLKEPIINTSESFFDDFVQANADFRYKSGLSPKIIRTVAGHCCDWCASVAGTYDYADIKSGSDIYRRHQFCRCVVTFESGRQRQNVWSKQTWEDSPATLESRKTVGLSQGRGETVTAEYFGTATPGKGKIERESGYDEKRHTNEIKTAQWLHDTFGGDILLLNESDVEGQKRADFLWNGKLWDLKTTTTEKSANTAIQRGLRQLKGNPGGIILDYENHKISSERLITVIEKRMQWLHGESPVDIMVLSNGKVLRVFRYINRK